MEKFTVDLDKVLDDFEDTEELGHFIEQDDKKAPVLEQRPDEQDSRPDLIAPFEGCDSDIIINIFRK